MRVTVKQAKHLIVNYDIDPVDLIAAVHQAEYGVTIMGDGYRSYQILVEAGEQRARFQVLNGGCDVFRLFPNLQVLCRELAYGLPMLYQEMQAPGAYFECICQRGPGTYRVPYSRLPELATFYTLQRFERQYVVQTP